MLIENYGDISIYQNLISKATTYLKNTFIDGLLKVPHIETTNTFLKLKGGVNGTQILHSDNSLIIDANSVSVNLFKPFNLITEEDTYISIININSPEKPSYSSLFLKSNTISSKIQVGNNSLMIGTSSTHKIIFAVNTDASNVIPMTIQANGDVNISTKFTNTSDSKLKDNQQNASLSDIQNIFNNIDVKNI